jgi:hypothetical protein
VVDRCPIPRTPPPPIPLANLEWLGERWHCQGRPIHAGDFLEVYAPGVSDYGEESVTFRPGTDRWLLVRIESVNQGRELVAHLDHHGLMFQHRISPYDRLRWPEAR